MFVKVRDLKSVLCTSRSIEVKEGKRREEKGRERTYGRPDVCLADVHPVAAPVCSENCLAREAAAKEHVEDVLCGDVACESKERE